MDRPLFLLILASLLGIATLAGLGRFTEPPRVPLSELGGHVGATVLVEGHILQPHYYDPGYFRGLVSDGNVTVPLSASIDLGPSAGDLIEARARVLQEGGVLSLELPTGHDLRVLRPWREDHVPLAAVLDHPWTRRDAPLRTSGYLAPTDRATWLQDPVKDARIEILHAPMRPGLVLVDALLVYRPDRGAFHLDALDVQPADP